MFELYWKKKGDLSRRGRGCGGRIVDGPLTLRLLLIGFEEQDQALAFLQCLPCPLLREWIGKWRKV